MFKSEPIRHLYLAGLHENEDYFRFTRGRFVSNKKHEISQRYVRFNLQELARLTAEAVGSKSCVSIEKYPDGMYNKALLLTMDDGTQAVAKVPNPNAGRPHFTTASEVATMEFISTVGPFPQVIALTVYQVRETLGTPVPKVHAWSSRAQENTIGVEYIIMEKILGVQLDFVWAGMGIEDRFTIAKAIARYQKTWISFLFKKLGSLYYAEDLDRHNQSLLYTDCHGVTITDPRFAVGLSTGRDFSDDGRVAVDFDKGPCETYVPNLTPMTDNILGNTLEEYQSAIGHREIACVQSLPRLPRSPVTLCGPGIYRPTREKKLKAIQCYLTMIKYLLLTN